MTTQTPDSRDLNAIANLLAHCRESARALRHDELTYYLDMACEEARCEFDHPSDRLDGPASKRMFGIAGIGGDVGEPRLLDLRTIRTATDGCLNWAQDIDRGTLAYVLKMTLLAVNRAAIDQG